MQAAAECVECTAGTRVPRSGLPRVFVCAREQGITALGDTRRHTQRESDRERFRERERAHRHTHKIWPRVWVWVCVCICVYVCVCECVCVCVCVCVYFVWACVCDCCHVRTSRGLSDDRIRPPCSIEDAASDAKRTRKIFACVAKKHLLEQHQSSPPSHLARA